MLNYVINPPFYVILEKEERRIITGASINYQLDKILSFVCTIEVSGQKRELPIFLLLTTTLSLFRQFSQTSIIQHQKSRCIL